jgi:hypothetical protein
MNTVPSFTYWIVDNGGFPFKVITKGLNVSIYNNYVEPPVLIKKIKAKKIFRGNTISGASIVIQLTNEKFLFIGFIIYEFNINPEDVAASITFLATDANNDSISSTLVCKNNIYFLSVEKYVARDKFPESSNFRDAYGRLWGHIGDEMLFGSSKDINTVSMICERLRYPS